VDGTVFCRTVSGKPIHIPTYADLSFLVDKKEALFIYAIFEQLLKSIGFAHWFGSQINEQLLSINDKTDCLW